MQYRETHGVTEPIGVANGGFEEAPYATSRWSWHRCGGGGYNRRKIDTTAALAQVRRLWRGSGRMAQQALSL